MEEKLVETLNEYFARPEVVQFQKYARVVACDPDPFDSRKIDWPAIAPRTDVPDEYKDTALGKQAIKGQPAMKGRAFKHWAKCIPPEDDPTAFDRTREIFSDMPLQFNNIAWIIRGEGGEMTGAGLHFL